jgi:hypothetical protein
VDLTLTGFSDDELKKYRKGLEVWEKRERVETFDLAEPWRPPGRPQWPTRATCGG